MKLPLKMAIAMMAFCFVFPFQNVEAQKKTRKLKRPSSRVGISSVDKFVRESFNLYDKVYVYDGYHEAGKSLSDDDYEILIDVVEDGQGVLASAPDAVSALDGAGVLKQGKGTLQLNRSKKALRYSIKTAKKLLTTKPKKNEDGDETNQDTAVAGNDDQTNTNSGGSNGSSSSSDSNTSTTTPSTPKQSEEKISY